MKVDFDTLSDHERGMILVASDATYVGMANKFDWEALAKDIGPAVLHPVLALLGVLKASNRLLEYEIAKREGLGAGGEIPIPHMTVDEARARFTFPLSHPRDGHLYVLNPCDEKQYLSPESADEHFAQEKLGAFLELCSALGARDVEVLSGEATEKTAEGQVNAASQLGLSVSVGTDGQIHRQLCAEFTPPTTAPVVPPPLERWLSMDPVLRAFARTRLSGKAMKVSVSLSFGASSLISGKVRALVKGLKVDLGAGYKEVKKSTWKFEVSFWPWPGS